MLPTIPVPPKRVDEYREPAGEEAVDRLREAARPLLGARLLNVNSTAFGGGVAELLFTQVALLNDLGIETEWKILEGSDAFFAVTKAVHNALQGSEVDWSEDMALTYLESVAGNARGLTETYDYVVVHDPQPAALLALVEETRGRRGKWVWRCHIDLSAPHPAVWEFFAGYVNRYDAVVFTMADFGRPEVTRPVQFIAPSIDPLSPKNTHVDADTIHEVLHRYGIDRHRPLVAQVSRFDPWKDPIGVIDTYRLVRKQHPDVQLVLVGIMAHDDPEAWELLRATEEHRASDPDIHLLTNLQEVGNLEVNALQRAAAVVIQKSLREGFGLTVSEALWKEKAVVGGRVGGIRLQIEDGVSGFLVDSVEACAERTVELLSEPDLRARLGWAGRERVRERFLATRELEDILRLLASLR